MTEEHQPRSDEANRWRRAAVEGAADTTAVVLGGFVHGPEGAVLAAPVPSLIVAAVEGFSFRWSERAKRRAGRVLMVASQRLDDEPGGLLDGLEGKKEILATQALSAGAATALDAKIIGLGHVLADSLATDDDAKLDEYALVLSALADMETPHLKVLAWFAEDRSGFPVHVDAPWADAALRWGTYTRKQVESNFEQYGIALDGVFATLDRHGLIAEVPPNLSEAFDQFQRRGIDGRMGNVRNQDKRWRVTPLGVTTVRYVVERARAREAVENGGSDLN